MNDASAANLDRYLELLAARTLGDLSSDESQQLDALAGQFPEIEQDEFDQVAAAVNLALMPMPTETMPANVRDTIQRDAAQHLNRQDSGGAGQIQQHESKPVSLPQDQNSNSVGRREAMAWLATAELERQ